MSSTVAKTYRLSVGLHSLIVSEAESLKTSESDIVRLALRQHFDERLQQERIDASEQRLTARIDAQGERLGHLIGQILALAQPQ